MPVINLVPRKEDIRRALDVDRSPHMRHEDFYVSGIREAINRYWGWHRLELFDYFRRKKHPDLLLHLDYHYKKETDIEMVAQEIGHLVFYLWATRFQTKADSPVSKTET